MIMKIVKRCNYKIREDELVVVGVSEKYAKIICKELNKKHKDKNYFFQVVSDNFETKKR
jgi:5,10-methylene-tetrahydrofolate dehydrogenase/methenyl tetrahydrofolate cyclohydrolase